MKPDLHLVPAPLLAGLLALGATWAPDAAARQHDAPKPEARPEAKPDAPAPAPTGPLGLPVYPGSEPLSEERLRALEEDDDEEAGEVLGAYSTSDSPRKVMAFFSPALARAGFRLDEVEIEFDQTKEGRPTPRSVEYEVTRVDPDTGEETSAEVELRFEPDGKGVTVVYESGD